MVIFKYYIKSVSVFYCLLQRYWSTNTRAYYIVSTAEFIITNSVLIQESASNRSTSYIQYILRLFHFSTGILTMTQATVNQK